jgi:predicted RNase H-like HicB family nuclease
MKAGVNSGMRKKELKDYMSLKYRINLRPLSEEDGGGWLAEAVELPGCMSDGETPEEAIRNLEGAKEAWLAVSLEKGYPVPVRQLSLSLNITGALRFVCLNHFTEKLPKLPKMTV